MSRQEYNKRYYQENKERLLLQQKEYHEKERERNPIHMVYLRLKSRAKKEGLEFNLEESDLISPKLCPILGIEMYYTKGRQTDNTPSCDRRNNSKGYIKGNTVMMSLKANRMKQDLTPEICNKFLEYMKE